MITATTLDDGKIVIAALQNSSEPKVPGPHRTDGGQFDSENSEHRTRDLAIATCPEVGM
jgi:hypothetical protein